MSALPSQPGASLREVVDRNAAGKGSVFRLTQECFERIHRKDDRIRAMVSLDEERALQRAGELDELVDAGHDPFPLHGIPVIIKEIFSIEGMPDSSGSKMPTPELFQGEGSFVRQLREAGCVILGKSLSTEFAFGQFNTNRPMPVNPVDEKVERATGGSSCGSAAALAAGYCGFSVGTDTGGSVRSPAAMCGLFGYKPSVGLWPADGIFPLSTELDTPGIFTASAADAAFVFERITGAMMTPSRAGKVLRIGVPEAYFLNDLDVEVAAAFERAKEVIRMNGHELAAVELPSLGLVGEYFAGVVPAELLENLGRQRVRKHSELLDPLTRNRLEGLPENPDYSALKAALVRLRSEASSVFRTGGVDLLMTPTVPCVAPLQSKLRDEDRLPEWQAYISRNTRVMNALDMPAVSIPLPAPLPVGLQLSAPAGTDAGLLSAAASIECILA